MADTNAEILCAFMEPKPEKGPFDFRPWRNASPIGWWVAERGESLNPDEWPNRWVCRNITLNECHQIEARLTEEQWLAYWLEIAKGGPPEIGYWRCIHASVEDKLKALAEVLRPMVEGGGKS